jgi:hypothetical protein
MMQMTQILRFGARRAGHEQDAVVAVDTYLRHLVNLRFYPVWWNPKREILCPLG